MKPLLISAGEGQTVSAFGDTIEFKLFGEHTNDTVVLGLAITPPGGGPPLHLHRNEDEIFIIVEGDLEIFFDDQWHKTKPGDVFFGPRNFAHKFRNAGSKPSKHWVIATPSGFDVFYKKCEQVFKQPGPPDMARVMEICGEHGAEVLEQPQPA